MSRCVWFSAAGGLALAGLAQPAAAPLVGAAGVVFCLLGFAAFRSGGRGAGAGICGHCVPFLLVVLSLLVGASWGAVRVGELLHGDLAGRVGERCEIVVEVSEQPRARGQGASFAAVSLGPVGSGERLLVEIARAGPGLGGSPELREGSVLRVRGSFRTPETPKAPSGSAFDERAWLAREGIGVVLSADSAGVALLGHRAGLAGVLDGLRRRARSHMSVGIDPVTGSMLKGILLGDKADIPETMLQAFRRAGTAHMLAVSGLHVGALAGFVMAGLQAARVSPGGRTVAGSAVVVLFALLTGAGPSVTRAAVMVIVVLAARFAGRGRDTWSALGLAAVVVLAREPGAVAGPGFQLSFSAVAALLCLTRPLESRLRARLPEGLATAAAVSLAAGIGTAPVSLLTFGQVSLVGVFANPLAVPVVPLIMALGFGSVAAGFLSLSVSGALNTVSGVLVGWVSAVSTLMAKAPVMTWANAASVIMGVSGALLCGRMAARYRGSRGSRMMKAGSLHPAARVMAGLAGALLLGVLPLGTSAAASRATVWWAARDWPTVGEARVIDVGEGSALLVRSPDGVSVLVDGGPAGSGLLGDLQRLGVSRLDVLVVSHPHADHFAGLAEVVERMPVGLFVDHVEEVSPPGGVAAGMG
ncbi:MAG TPA: ComEC/Rec2 family competence protein, partial [Thermoleophilia bacterium]|nr:ComEC/Rec2 family competence protein [Thermoleophilia bacterium]